jgi:aryl-alcohol dehydrogenase-like predicted oxidoreductase
MNYLNKSAAHQLSRPVSIQNPYSLLNRSFETGLAEMAIREDIGLLAYSPLAFGRLSGKYEAGTDSPDDRINQFSTMARYNSDQSKEATRQYMDIAKKYNISLAQMSLAFVNSRDFVTSNIIGATNMIQLKENIESINIMLSKECLKDIEAVHQAIPDPAP